MPTHRLRIKIAPKLFEEVCVAEERLFLLAVQLAIAGHRRDFHAVLPSVTRQYRRDRAPADILLGGACVILIGSLDIGCRQLDASVKTQFLSFS